MADDRFDLQRFVDAQRGTHDAAVAELRRGRKTTHWMWFVFPQLSGLGTSPTARHYAISGLAEARAYLAEPTLGPRLFACAELVLAHAGRDAHAIFGAPDDMKLQSCMTLFERAGGPQEHAVFAAVLDAFYGGRRDARTLALLCRP